MILIWNLRKVHFVVHLWWWWLLLELNRIPLHRYDDLVVSVVSNRHHPSSISMLQFYFKMSHVAEQSRFKYVTSLVAFPSHISVIALSSYGH